MYIKRSTRTSNRKNKSKNVENPMLLEFTCVCLLLFFPFELAFFFCYCCWCVYECAPLFCASTFFHELIFICDFFSPINNDAWSIGANEWNDEAIDKWRKTNLFFSFIFIRLHSGVGTFLFFSSYVIVCINIGWGSVNINAIPCWLRVRERENEKKRILVREWK